MPETASCNAVVGYPRLCSGAEEGSLSKELASEHPSKNDDSYDLPANDDDSAVSDARICEDSVETVLSVCKTNEVSTETPVKTDAKSADPKTETGCVIDGMSSPVDETILDLRCSRD